MSATKTGEIIYISNYPYVPEEQVKKDLQIIVRTLGSEKKLTKGDEELVNQALLTINLALDHKTPLSDSIQEELKKVPRLLLSEKVIDGLPDDPLKSKLYNRITNVFRDHFPNREKKQAPPLELDQTKAVTAFTRNFVKDYIHSPEFSSCLKPIYQVAASICEDFESTFPEILSEFFTCPSEAVTQNMEVMANEMLSQIKKFLKDLGLAEDQLIKKGIKLNELSAKDEEKQLIRQLNTIYSKRGAHPIIPNDFSEKEVANRLLAKIKTALNYTIDDSKMPIKEKAMVRFAKAMTAPVILLIGYCMFTPYSVALLVNRLLEWSPTISAKTQTASSSSSSSNETVNQHFCSSVGGSCVDLIEELFSFGKAGGMFGLLVSFIVPGLKSSKREIGKQVHELITTLFQDNYLIKGIMLADHILYDHSGSSPKPTMVGMDQYTDEEKQSFQKKVKEKLNGKLYPFLIEALKASDTPGTWIASNMSSLQDFCDRLSMRLYRVGQQELLLKTFFFYLIDGYCDALRKMK